MSAWFIADLHLDPGRPEGFDAMRASLDVIARDGGPLYILGDLFEMWIGDDDDDPFTQACCDVLAAFARARPLFTLHGNRDFLTGAGFAARTGATLLPDPTVVTLPGGRAALLLHGDSLCIDDVDYQRVRAQLRAPAWQADILARPLAERRAIGQGMRAQSRAANANTPAAITDVNEEAVARVAREHGVELIIHGHTHRPATHHRQGATPHTRIVLGDWTPHGQLLRVDDDGRFQLLGSASLHRAH
jgi:UDP-2,3-diacylglucosamine hydrolase